MKQQQAFSIKSTFIWKVKKEFALCQGTKYLKKINEAKNNRNNDKNIMLLPWQSEKTCIRTLLLSKILTKTYDMTTIAFQKSSYYHLISNYVINEKPIYQDKECNSIMKVDYMTLLKNIKSHEHDAIFPKRR